MTNVQAVVFGLVQGLTEFLPVSSSGHLALLRGLWAIENVSVLFDILLHLATLLAVCIVFRRPLLKIVQGLLRVYVHRDTYRKRTEKESSSKTEDSIADGSKAPNEGGNEAPSEAPNEGGSAETSEEARKYVRIFWLLVGATVVTAILGLGVEFLVRPAENVDLVSGLFIATALVLIITKFVQPGTRSYADLSWRYALFIGFAQGLGVFPGISRSGITISAGMFSGLRREEAGEFSFLLSIPAILAATVIKLPDLAGLQASIGVAAICIGMLISFLSGYASLKLLLRLIRKGRLYLFALYLIPLGVIVQFFI